jgi:hypothetical protein
MADVTTEGPRDLDPYLDRLRDLPFVRHVQLAMPPVRGPARSEALVKLRTRRRTFTLVVRTKRTYLDRTLANALIAEHAALARTERLPLLLLARYIPRPTGERLANAGVNFVDRVGNIHLALGDEHQVLLLGRREPRVEPTARRPGPALVQLYFVLLADAAAAAWPVRTLAKAAGVGKTAAATGLQRLVRLGVLARTQNRAYRVVDRAQLVDDFIRGYEQVLRAHLVVGRFRAPDLNPDRFLDHVASAATQVQANWAVTGGQAAHALDRFYRGEDLPLFIEPFTQALQRTLRLVPDRQGPVTLFRPFGERWAWRIVNNTPVAHPWLVYAELLYHGEPRALEVAEHVREEHLKP